MYRNKFVTIFRVFHRKLHRELAYTKDNYLVTRGNYNYLKEDHVEYFKNLLGGNRVVTDVCDVEKYNVDWYFQAKGNSSLVLKPKNVDEVSQILSFCNNNRIAVCPQGGNTSVNGGSVPVFDEIVLSMELMNEIVDFDPRSGIVVCGAGCILANIDEYLENHNLTVPLDIASRGTCQIGGNVSTNAGGIRLMRYGNLQGNVVGIEAVKANGDIIDCLNCLKKDNTGYHLKHLFIGSEGTLGVITKVALSCPVRASSRTVAFLGLQNFDKVLKTLHEAKFKLNEILSAVEVMDARTMDFVKEYNNLASPIGNYPFYLLIETMGSDQELDELKVTKFLENSLNSHLILNGVVAGDARRIEEIWKVRDLSHGYKSCGPILHFDLSLKLDDYYNLVNDVRRYMGASSPRVFGYGHLGDGNLHLEVQLAEKNEEIQRRVETYVYRKVKAFRGSISAEHGLGFFKANYLSLAKTPGETKIMREFKRLFDPNGILNPYKVFPY